MDEDVVVAEGDVVGVVAGDGEVVGWAVVGGVGVEAEDFEGVARGGEELVALFEVAGVDPGLLVGVPEGVVVGRDGVAVGFFEVNVGYSSDDG